MSYHPYHHSQNGEVIPPLEQAQSQDGAGAQADHAAAVDPAAAANNNDPKASLSTGLPKKAAFVHKLYAMLSDPNLKNLIWWTDNAEEGTFALQPGAEFAQALTGYFKHGNVASFVRQLHMYGFHKVCDQPQSSSGGSSSTSNHNSSAEDSGHAVWEFIHSNGMFKKGDKFSLLLIKRRTSSNVTKVKSELTRNLDVAYHHAHQHLPPPHPAQPQQYYYQYVPLQPQHLPPPPGYPVQLAQGAAPPQSIIYYPVPSRYPAPQSPYAQPLTPPYQEPVYAYTLYQVPGQPQMQQQQQQHQPQQHQHQPQNQQQQQQHQQQHQQLQQNHPQQLQNHPQHPQQPQHPQHPQQLHPLPKQREHSNPQLYHPYQIHHSTPTGSAQSRSATPASYADPRVNFYMDRIAGTSRELVHGQQVMQLKSEILVADLRDTANDTMGTAESLTSLKPSSNTHPEYHSRLNSLKSTISARNERYDDEIQDARSHQASIVSNSSQISFYETNSRPRIPSMFVDPLAPVPSQLPVATPQPAAPSTPLLHRHSSHEYRTSPAASDVMPSKTSSLGQLITEPISQMPRRAGSHPGFQSSSSATVQPLLTSEPRQRTSIPGIGHIHSQIRPSLVEFHRSGSPLNASSSIASSLNGNSIFSNKASLSSVSSSVRNSIPQLLNDPVEHKLDKPETSNPDYKTHPQTHSNISSTYYAAPAPGAAPGAVPGAASDPVEYKPQPYTPKQFSRPIPGANYRNNSTVSPKTAKNTPSVGGKHFAPVPGPHAPILPPISANHDSKRLHDTDDLDELHKKPKLE